MSGNVDCLGMCLGVRLKCVWRVFGNAFEVRLECVWKCCLFVKCVWSVLGVCLECVWNVFGAVKFTVDRGSLTQFRA